MFVCCFGVSVWWSLIELCTLSVEVILVTTLSVAVMFMSLTMCMIGWVVLCASMCARCVLFSLFGLMIDMTRELVISACRVLMLLVWPSSGVGL